jgi:hypothetical protein
VNDSSNIGQLANFGVSALVLLYGTFAWLLPHGRKRRFRERAYFCWWLSWLCWVGAWLFLLSTPESTWPRRVLTLSVDNLNTTFLVLVFLILTRGDKLAGRQLVAAFLRISIPLAIATVPLYRLANTLDFALGVHATWSLGLSVAAPVLVGWAANLRFNTWLLLAVGIVYGFAQPFVYGAELHVTGLQGINQPVVDMALAALKVIWAITFVQVLATSSTITGVEGFPQRAERRSTKQQPSTALRDGDSLILPRPKQKAKLAETWDAKHRGHAIVLAFGYVGFLIWMVALNLEKLKPILEALAGIAALIGACYYLWGLIDHVVRGPEPPEPPLPPPTPPVLQETVSTKILAKVKPGKTQKTKKPSPQ